MKIEILFNRILQWQNDFYIDLFYDESFHRPLLIEEIKELQEQLVRVHSKAKPNQIDAIAFEACDVIICSFNAITAFAATSKISVNDACIELAQLHRELETIFGHINMTARGYLEEQLANCVLDYSTSTVNYYYTTAYCAHHILIDCANVSSTTADEYLRYKLMSNETKLYEGREKIPIGQKYGPRGKGPNFKTAQQIKKEVLANG